MATIKKISTLFLALQSLYFTTLLAQQINCNYYTPLVHIDFGNTGQSKQIDLSYLYNYKKTNSQCPDDGYFTFTPYTNHCFNGNWHTLPQDHTLGDNNGNMMLVNAATNPGIFFNTSITGLTAGSTYQLAAWFVNICKNGSGCSPTPPNILITVFCNGKILASFETGNIDQSNYPIWKKYEGIFTLPTNTNKLLLQMKDLTIGGCGNDFALDDIELKPCLVKSIVPTQIATTQPIKTITTQPKLAKVIAENKALQKLEPNINTTNKIEPIIEKKQLNIPKIFFLPTNSVLTNRENLIVKRIKMPPTTVTVDLYDNGEIDGDTVSVYHNSVCIKNGIGISAKPISFNIVVNATHPHHEIILVAINEGSIPPNTSLMIVTAAGKRYEVFISADNKKNAKLIFDLE